MEQFQPAVEPCRTDVARIADLPPSPVISDDKYDADNDSEYLPNLGGAEMGATIRWKQTEFSLKQFAKRIMQPKSSTFNKWNKVCATG
jgi:hypothetical protein